LAVQTSKQVTGSPMNGPATMPWEEVVDPLMEVVCPMVVELNK
jgi:hypothetical protein